MPGLSSIAVWHVPRLYDLALRHPAVHDIEHATFFTTGLLVWTQLIDPARRGRLSIGQRIAFAGTVYVFGQLLSDVLFLVSTPLYPAYAEQQARLFGLSALQDQQFAGLVMMGEQLLTLGSCVAILLASSLRSPDRPRPSPRADSDLRPGLADPLRAPAGAHPGRGAGRVSWPGIRPSREPTRQPGS